MGIVIVRRPKLLRQIPANRHWHIGRSTSLNKQMLFVLNTLFYPVRTMPDISSTNAMSLFSQTCGPLPRTSTKWLAEIRATLVDSAQPADTPTGAELLDRPIPWTFLGSVTSSSRTSCRWPATHIAQEASGPSALLVDGGSSSSVHDTSPHCPADRSPIRRIMGATQAANTKFNHRPSVHSASCIHPHRNL